MRLLRLMLLVVLALMAMPAVSQAASEKFYKPMLGNYRLDYCLTWQKSCGGHAAEAFCQSKGYDTAKDFSIAKQISTPTRTIGDNSVCDQGNCDGFQVITCEKQLPDPIFFAPKVKGVALDWCLNWAKDCGKPAADQFCRMQGHAEAASFAKQAGVGPTRVLGTSQMCDDASCDGFKSITCTGDLQLLGPGFKLPGF